jgi:hypothetical protein
MNVRNENFHLFCAISYVLLCRILSSKTPEEVGFGTNVVSIERLRDQWRRERDSPVAIFVALLPPQLVQWWSLAA